MHHYLLAGGRFRYTTNPPPADPYPLVDFLLRGQAGHCQQFAGAAALLLRLAGVPVRVVVRFATGGRQHDGRFQVRDVDAHAWIEVYFQDYGWVAFTPPPRPTFPASWTPRPSRHNRYHGGPGGPRGLGGLGVGAILVALAGECGKRNPDPAMGRWPILPARYVDT